MIWTVDPHCDRIRECKESRRKDEFTAYETRRFHVFDSEAAAVRFVIERGEREIRNAMDEIKTTKQRLKKHQARLNRISGESTPAESVSTGVSDARDRESV
jgi:hypothetical protein